jgi:MGT family glycosyltransferase
LKALFVNVSSVGHVVPTLGLVRSLVKDGVDVAYLEVEAHRPELEAFGARFVPLAPLAPYGGPQGAQVAALPAVLAHSAIESTGHVLDVIEAEQPDVVVHDLLCLWGRLAADLAGVPRIASIASAALSRNILTNDPVVRSWRAMAGDVSAFEPFIAGCWEQIHHRYGCPPEDEISTVLNTAPTNIVHLSRSLQPHEAEFGPEYLFCGSGEPARQVHQEFDWSRVEGKRIVYMSFGTAHDPGHTFYANVAEAMRHVDATLVAVSSPSMTQPEPIAWPEGTIICANGSAPQLALLDRAALFISHVGGGAVREAAWTATPVLGLPQTLEQDLLLHHVAGHRVALRLSNQPDADEIAAAIRAILADPCIHSRACALRDLQRTASTYEQAVGAIVTAMKARG